MFGAGDERWGEREHEEWSEYVGAYVLGAVVGDELAGFEAHMGRCAQCRDEVRELSPVASVLAAGVTPREVPPELLGRIMASVRPEAELLRAAGAGADRPPRRSRVRWRPVTAALAAGALAAAVAVGFVAGNTGTTTTHTISARVAIPPGASAHIVRSDHAELVVAGFPPSPAEHVYQVWYVPRSGGAPRPTKKLFVVGQDGSADISLPSLKGVRQVMVTAEQPTGSTTGRPSGPPVLTATLI